MTAMNPDASRQAVVEAALVLLERMGPTRRTWPPSRRTARRCGPSPSPAAAATANAGTRRAYGSDWNRVLEHWAIGVSMSPPRRRSGS